MFSTDDFRLYRGSTPPENRQPNRSFTGFPDSACNLGSAQWSGPTHFFIPTPWFIRFCHSRKAAIMPSRNPLHARDHTETVRTRRTAQEDTGGCNPNLADPPGLWVIIRFRFETPYWTAIGQSKFRSGLGINPPIVVATFDNDDLNQPSICLAERGRCMITDPARYIPCLRKSC